MKCYFRAPAWSYFLIPLTLLITVSSFGDENECSHLASSRGPTEYQELGDYHFPRITSISELLSTVVQKYSGQPFAGLDFIKAISQVYSSIHADTTLTAIEKGEKMGQFGLELNPAFEAEIARFPSEPTGTPASLKAWAKRKVALDQVKRMKFVVAMSVEDFENFSVSEFDRVSKENFVMTRGTVQEQQTHIPLDEYSNYIKSYLTGIFGGAEEEKALYRGINQGSLGILSIPDIRDITSYNLWPMYLVSHDIRHVHYGLSHPLALAVMMRATRSKIALRYTMLGGLYEGVDRVQYMQEQTINRFFAHELGASGIFPGINRGMDLEEAMITLAYAPKSVLDKICETVQYGNTFESYAATLANWKPKMVDGTTLQGQAMTHAGRDIRDTHEDLEDDVRHMVQNYTARIHESEALKAQLAENPSMSLNDDQKMLLWMMNFQLNPASPEIVVDGLPYKDDGRAHYSGNVPEDPLGLGDH